MRNNNCRTTLHSGHAFYGLGGWCLAMAILAFTLEIAVINPTNYLHIHGNKAILARVLFVTASAAAIIIRMTALQKIMMYYRFKDLPLLPDRLLWLLGFLILPPVLEMHCMIKLGLRQSVTVPYFFCEMPDADIDIMKLAENVRSRYFAKAESGGFELLVATNAGLVTVLLQESRIYAFLLEEQWEATTPFALPKGGTEWKMEESQTGDRALVWEVQYAPCCQPVTAGLLEKELSELLIDALDELSSLTGQGGC